MADYDPADPPTYNAADEIDDAEEYNQDDAPDSADHGDEESDYDPSSYDYGDGEKNQQEEGAGLDDLPNGDAPTHTSQPVKTKTRAGFIVDESDEEQDDESGPQASQPYDPAGVQSEPEVAEKETQDISLNSVPQDTVASGTSLNGSTTVPVPASTSSPIPDPTAPIPANQGDIPMPMIPSESTPQQAPVPETSARTTTAATIHDTTAASRSAMTNSAPGRLPHDKVGQLEDRIEDDPKGDSSAWISLIDHYREKGQFDLARKVYERFFEKFPYAVAMWVKYIQMEKDLDETNRIAIILSNCVMQVPNVRLWQLYLDHIRRTLPLMNDLEGKNRSQIAAAFEATLENVGIDPDAGFLWREYVDFIKDGPGTVGGSSWQDLQKVDLLRKAYQRSFKVPHSEFVKLWKDYESFERGLNAQTARKHIAEQSPHYMQCRTAKTQLDQLVDGLDRSSLPRLPPIHGCAGEDEFGDQVDKWRSWIAWEKDEDPLVYKGTEDDAYQKRVLYVYRQATMFLCFYPEIWFEAATWCFSQGTEKMTKEGEQLLDSGIAANPESVLLALMKADRVESSLDSGNTDEVLIRNGARLDEPYEAVLTALYALRTKIQERDKKLISHIQEHFANLAQDDSNGHEQDDDEAGIEAKRSAHQAEMEAQTNALKIASNAQLDKLKRTISSVWVAKMQAFRRVQGQGKPTKKGESSNTVKGFRGVFSESRPRGMLSSDVYIASALMEWNCYRDGSAIKIFERGMKLFPSDETFVLEYIKHLIAMEDRTNARVVFESTIKKITDASDLTLEQKRHKCRRLLGYMHDYESKYGDLAHIHKVENRMRELYPEEPVILRFSHRYALPEFDAIEVQLILSPTQALPKTMPPPFIAAPAAASGLEVPQVIESTELLLGPNGPYVASPKRPLDDSDTESPQRKFMRAESPLKGAAGFRIQSSKAAAAAAGGGGSGGFATKTFIPNSAPALAPPLPPQVEGILQILPNAASYNSVRLDPAKLVAFLSTVPIDFAKAMSAPRR